ncbi:IS110 family transposase [Myceligenerans indicum]|uniref:IS110 family transposase n=1 Tax=Myceligenerans indicum TaxID=2593663 RepID=A0ABS1LMK2_9MICO|nr:IS110 family transposase [Myceligenerans indicum]MBL0887435.1 IS110 family transposase [Myceligenerans indicum]
MLAEATSTAPTVAQAYMFVVGVDTHARAHVYSVIEAITGAVVETQSFPTTPAGLARASAWIARRTVDTPEAVLISMEGTGSYGRLAAAQLAGLGYRIVEALTPVRGKGRAKSDELDAQRAARDVLGLPADRLRDHRTGAVAGALQVLTTARDRLTTERTAQVNALTGLLRTHDLGLDAGSSLSAAQIRVVKNWRTRTESLDQRVARAESIRLAARIADLDEQLNDNEKTLRDLVTEHAPDLLAEPGIGPYCAAVILATWAYPGRVRSEAAFARLAGTAPIPASSGNRADHHRLDRGGDRRLNRALHIATLSRMRNHDETHSYVHKRTAEGRTHREIRRQLKRYLTRKIHRLLTRQNTLAPTS